MKFYVYLDDGVDPPLFRQVVRSVRRAQPHLSLSALDAAALTHSDWEKSCAALIIPGGRDVPYHRALRGKGAARIRAYVQQGGRYLGICAGGYFGSRYVVFEEGGELEVCEERELAFFPGRAVGPAYEKGVFRYGSDVGARIAHLNWGDESLYAYYNGGCYFEEAHAHPDIEVLATYRDLKGEPPAVIACAVGKGKAILSGVHIEYSAHHPSPYQERLALTESRREALLNQILIFL